MSPCSARPSLMLSLYCGFFFSFNAIITWTDRLSDLTSVSLTTASSSLICLVHPSWHSSHLRLKDYSVFLEDSWVKLDLSLQLFVVLQTAKWEGLNSPWSNFHCLQCVYGLWNADFREYCIFKHLLLYFYYTFIYLYFNHNIYYTLKETFVAFPTWQIR